MFHPFLFYSIITHSKSWVILAGRPIVGRWYMLLEEEHYAIMIIHFPFWKASQKFTTLMKLNKLWLDPWRERITCLEHFERSLQWSQIHWKFQVICIVVRDSDVLCLINLVCSFSQEKSRIGQVVLLLNKGLFLHVRYYEWCDCVSFFKSFTSQLTPKILAHFFHCVGLNKFFLTWHTELSWTLQIVFFLCLMVPLIFF